MATETLNIVSWNSGWPTGFVSNIDEPTYAPDGSTIATTTGGDSVIFGMSDITTMSALDVVTNVYFVVRCGGSSVGGPEPTDLKLNVELLINGVSRGTGVITCFSVDLGVSGALANKTVAVGAWNAPWSIGQLNSAQCRITTVTDGPLTGNVNEWLVDCIDLVVAYTEVEPIYRYPAEASLALTGQAPNPTVEINSPITVPVEETLDLTGYAPGFSWQVLTPEADLSLASTLWYAIGASERARTWGWDAGWNANGFLSNIDEWIEDADGSTVQYTLDGITRTSKSVRLHFSDFSEIEDADTVLNVIAQVRLQVDHTFVGPEPYEDQAPYFTVEYMYGTISHGIVTVDPISYGTQHTYELNHSGWNQDWPIDGWMSLNAQSLRITAYSGGPGNTDTFSLDVANIIVEYEPQPPVSRSPAKGSVALAGHVPILVEHLYRAPSADSLALSGKSLVAKATSSVLPFYITRRLRGQIWTFVVNHVSKPGKATLTTAGQAPIRIADTLRLPSGSTLALAGQAPTATPSGNMWRSIARKSLRLGGEVPFGQVEDNQAGSPPRSTKQLAGKVPTVDQQRSYWITPAKASLAMAGKLPSRVLSGRPEPGKGAVVLAGKTPTASLDLALAVGAGAFTLDSVEPLAAYTTGELTLTGYAVTLTGSGAIDVGAATLTLTGQLLTANAVQTFSGALGLQGQSVTVDLTTGGLDAGAPGIIHLTEDRNIEFVAMSSEIVET